ncbi:hypothetical protein SAY86_004241 [Trapa natans]|uniref:NHL domain-containing protein n=1 Tax=Trapa natans TaxID=22666 RepID=A0AAN7RFH3_TRANT|nr:hypothetical protein SAY86_004241 [Trapa natans]
MDHKESNPIYELEEAATPLYNDSPCFFCFHNCFRSHRPRSSSPRGPSLWERVGSGELDDRWWVRGLRALKKVREWSEIVAGPRWKTFIRRFSRTRGGAGGPPQRYGRFHYDPLGYSLNFDDGPNSAELEDDEDKPDGFVRNFSARYAVVPGQPKHVPAAMDISSKGKEVLPLFE